MIVGFIAGVPVAVGLVLLVRALLARSRAQLADLTDLQVRRESVLRKECAELGWTLGEYRDGVWVVRGAGLPLHGYAAHSLMGIQRFRDGFVWGRDYSPGWEADGTPPQR